MNEYIWYCKKCGTGNDPYVNIETCKKCGARRD